MQIMCYANLTYDGKRWQAVSILPTPGIKFNFNPLAPAETKPGPNKIKGTLAKVDISSTNKNGHTQAFSFLTVDGEAEPMRLEFVPSESAPIAAKASAK